MAEPERWGTITEGCIARKCGKGRLYKEIADGLIEAKKDGRRTLVNLDDIRARLESLPKAEIQPLKNRPEQYRDFTKPRRRSKRVSS